ncbi:hypothetical protein EYF80_059233 [Liparis tanakae]|uniref:Uncharacterized protein n=1 Tax=Liparis tanakae TaxID=230148 RepID=A0A4Z2EPB3_9TELE|nr:hypothetical protein EYF80_059233 [Liparis tanakae]
MSVQLLGSLRATNPQVAMVSDFDIDHEADEIHHMEHDDTEVACQLPACVAWRIELHETIAIKERLEREALTRLKRIKYLFRKNRRLQQIAKELSGGATGSRRKPVKSRKRVKQVAEAEPLRERAEPEVAEAEPLRERAEPEMAEAEATFKGTGRGAAMRHLILPLSIEAFLDSYKEFIQGSKPKVKQLENAISKASRVRSFLYYLSVGKSGLADWLFLYNLAGIKASKLKRRRWHTVSPESLKSCQDQARLIDNHKTNREFGGAQIFLTLEEFSWLERWLLVRLNLGPKNNLVFITKGAGPVKNMVRYLQMAWGQMGLPGRPNFTDIRTAVSAHAKNLHTSGTRNRLAHFMCHNTETADRFYALMTRSLVQRKLRVTISPLQMSKLKNLKGNHRRGKDSVYVNILFLYYIVLYIVK